MIHYLDDNNKIAQAFISSEDGKLFVSVCIGDEQYDFCWNLLRSVLTILTERAIELNDPVLNIIMLNLSLYDGSHTDEGKEDVKKLRQIIKDKNL